MRAVKSMSINAGSVKVSIDIYYSCINTATTPIIIPMIKVTKRISMTAGIVKVTIDIVYYK